MITRDFGHNYVALDQLAPPPLHVQSTVDGAANWFPVRRPVLRPTPPGPQMVEIPEGSFGDDPTDPAYGRYRTWGMVGRLNPGGEL